MCDSGVSRKWEQTLKTKGKIAVREEYWVNLGGFSTYVDGI